MYVRLAFSVAAHLEPEILLVDEVLAVGDASFQRKCLGKMGDVASEGRTVLFVSHNQKAISDLCDRAIRLGNGRLADQGPSAEVVRRYLEEELGYRGRAAGQVMLEADPSRPMRLRSISVLDHDGQVAGKVEMGQTFRIRVSYDVNQPITSSHVICFVRTTDGVDVLGSGDADCEPSRLGERLVGHYTAEFEMPSFVLGEGRYSVTASLGVPFRSVFDCHESIIQFEVVDNSSVRRTWYVKRRPGILGFDLPWIYLNGEPVGRPD
jgi:lipopolysaccharide transport system ATP-binding protein